MVLDYERIKKNKAGCSTSAGNCERISSLPGTELAATRDRPQTRHKSKKWPKAPRTRTVPTTQDSNLLWTPSVTICYNQQFTGAGVACRRPMSQHFQLPAASGHVFLMALMTFHRNKNLMLCSSTHKCSLPLLALQCHSRVACYKCTG